MKPLRLTSVFTGLVLAASAVSGIAQQTSHEKVVVGYNKFNMVTGEERHKTLGEYLPYVLITHLVESPVGFLKDETAGAGNIQTSATTSYRFWLAADFSVSKGQFSINPYIFDYQTQSYKYFDGYSCPMNGILDQMKLVGAEIDEYLKTGFTAAKDRKKIAVACFGAASDDNSLREELALGLAVNLSNPNVKLYPWAQLSEYCNRRSTTPNEIINDLNADALLSGDIRISNDEVIVVPWVLVAGKQQVTLPEIVGKKHDYVALEKSLLNDINEFIDNILEQNEWKIESLDFQSNDYRVYWDKGMEYFDRNELYIAAYMFTKALALNPRSDTVATNLALVRQWQKRYAEAIRLYKQALAINPDYTEALYSLGTTYYHDGNYRKAVEYLLQARQGKAEIKDIPWLVGRCYLLMGEYKNAIIWYKDHLSQNPGDLKIRNELGEAYFNRGEDELALGCFTSVLQIAPHDSVARNFTGVTYNKKGAASFSKGKYVEAKSYFEKARGYTVNESLYNNLIFTYNKLMLFHESDGIIADGLREGVFDSASVFRKHAEYLLSEMQASAKATNFLNFGAASVRKFKQHTSINPNDAVGFWLMGSAYISMDSISKGVSAIEKSIKVDSADVRVFLDLGEAYILNNTPEKVASLFSRIHESLPGSRDKAIMLYLRSVAGIVAGRKDEQAEKELQIVFTEKKTKISAWSFYVFERWLSKARYLSPGKVEEIKKLTDQMKELF
jgi:tetratricopeptide (TPR) repeat protein